jgi:ComF family protein
MKYEKRTGGCQPGPGAVVESLLNCLFPPVCVLCGLGADEPGICNECESLLAWNRQACRRCGLPLPSGHDKQCGPCLLRPPPWSQTISPLLYCFPVNRLVQRFKFQRDLAAGRVLAKLMLRDLAGQTADVLVPVPLHWRRMLQRGFNQAFELATPIGKALDIPVLPAGLRRCKSGVAQSGLNAAERKKNIRGAFHWRHRQSAPKHVVLLDDVMTTGATATECAKVLLAAGAKRVDVWTAARAPLD